jgi:hypothetical protein
MVIAAATEAPRGERSHTVGAHVAEGHGWGRRRSFRLRLSHALKELAPRASFYANAAADLNACIRALDLDEARAIHRARVAPNRT